MAARLENLAVRREMRSYHSIITALARDGWDRIVLFDYPARPELSQKSIAEISERMGVEPLDAIYDLLLDGIDDFHGLMVIAFSYREEDIRVAFEHPGCMVGSDATALATSGVAVLLPKTASRFLPCSPSKFTAMSVSRSCR